MSALTWMHWQEEIIEAIRRGYDDVLPDVQRDDIDWEAWRPLYEQDYSPQAAVNAAFSSTLEQRSDRAA